MRCIVCRLLVLAIALCGNVMGAITGTSVKGFDVFFPQVAQGVGSGVSIETVLTLSNPYDEGINICLQSFNIDLKGTAQFRLSPFQTRQFVFRGGPIKTGWVRVIAEQTVGASARITTRPQEESMEVLTTITVLGQPLTSRALIPVLRNTPVADNTGIAIAYYQEGGLRFTLYDDAGNQVALREEQRGFKPGGGVSEQTAFLITDLFPSLGTFEAGTLLIEHVDPPNIAEGFAVTALYLRQGQFGAAEVTGIDDPREFLITPAAGLNAGAVAPQLEETYSIQIEQIFSNAILAIMTLETARAVARDRRVSEVEPSRSGPFLGGS